MAVDKFRPLLSEKDVAILLEALSRMDNTVAVAALRKKLSLCQFKIEAGLVKPSARVAQETVTKNSLENDLGVSEEEKSAWMQAEIDKLLGAPTISGANSPDLTNLKGFEPPKDLGNPFTKVDI